MPPADYPTSEQITASAFKLLVENPLFKVGSATIRGNEYRVFENAPANLTGIFRLGAGHGDKEFLYYEGETWTYAQMWAETVRCADALANGVGVKKGDRVALAMRNYPEWCAVYMAVISLGAVVVPLNAWWKTEELRYALKDCDAKIVIVDAKRFEYLAPLKDELGLTFILVRDADDSADHAYADL